MSIKACKQFYLSVEGETEQWYFEHLKKIINESERAKFKVKLEIKIQKSPVKLVKSIANPFDIEAFHVCDLKVMIPYT